MKLSTLAQYRELLETLTPKDGDLYIQQSLEPVMHTVSNSKITDSIDQNDLRESINGVKDSLQTFADQLGAIKAKVDQTILDIEPGYLKNSYTLYNQEMRNDSAEIVLNRRFLLDPDNHYFVQSRVQIHSNWKYPGLIIRPGLESWIEHMVALDPLYVIDQDYALLEPTKSKFNDAYVNRVRWCITDRDRESSVLSAIPNAQIGFVLAYNFFHYTPFEIMRGYLQEIYEKLRPGGVLAFTFNDCDRWGAIELAERSYMCYTPGRLVKSLLTNLDLETLNFQILDNAVSWIEVRKPGELSSLRGGQSLAKVIA